MDYFMLLLLYLFELDKHSCYDLSLFDVFRFGMT